MELKRRSVFATAVRVLVGVTLLAPVAFCSALYVDGRQAEKELPSKVRALEEACSKFSLVDAKDIGALRVLQRSISSGQRSSQDVLLESGEYNRGVYQPFPGSEYDELQLMLIDVIVDGKRLLTARVPTLVLPTRGIGLNQPPESTRSCPNSDLLGLILRQAANAP
jgi:hypothetical protein